MPLSAPSAHRGLILVLRQTGRFCSASQGVHGQIERHEPSLAPRRDTRSINGAVREQTHGDVGVWMAVSEWVRAMAGEHASEASAPLECSRPALVDEDCDSKLLFIFAWPAATAGDRSLTGVPPPT